METHNGLRIKDLRIIKNRSLSDIVIVDNLVHSFGLQIDNGISILDFTNNKDDKELLGVEKILLELRNVDDVRDYLRNRIALRKCL
jgi:CTD small phosphatase-like protein 2